MLKLLMALVLVALAGSERARRLLRRRNQVLVSQREFYAYAAEQFARQNVRLRRQVEGGPRA